jgi:signal transduction histidine kinase
MKGYLPAADRVFFHTYLLPVLLSRGRADEISLSLRANDGSYLPVLLNARRDESRGRSLNTCVFLAMHRRHLFESEVLTAKRAAEEAVRAEREAVERMKQVQVQLALRERLASVGTLAAGAAHEINNPLAYITVNLELVSEMLAEGESLAEEQRREIGEMITEVREGVERIRIIVSGLRSLTRTDDGRRSPVDVSQALEIAVRMTASARRTRASLEIQADPVPRVDADEGRLTQVFINLLSNAEQAMTEPSVARNVIRVIMRTDAAGCAIVEVHDNGPGIPADIHQRIFDPFFTTKPVGSGTGLGLSICHGIVSALGGSILLTSEVGAGACFQITLPPSRAAVQSGEMLAGRGDASPGAAASEAQTSVDGVDRPLAAGSAPYVGDACPPPFTESPPSTPPASSARHAA